MALRFAGRAERPVAPGRRSRLSARGGSAPRRCHAPPRGAPAAARWSQARPKPPRAPSDFAGLTPIVRLSGSRSARLAPEMRNVSPWWCRVDSNHRQRDYESRALPPELRHRRPHCRGPHEITAKPRISRGGNSSERLVSAPSACASSSGACRWRRAFSYSWPRAQVGWGAWDQDGCGAWIRTKDLGVMSRLAVDASSYAAPQLYSKTNGRRTGCVFRPLQTTSLCAFCDHHRGWLAHSLRARASRSALFLSSNRRSTRSRRATTSAISLPLAWVTK